VEEWHEELNSTVHKSENDMYWRQISLYQYCTGHCPLCEVYYVCPTFRRLGGLPSSGDRLSLYWQMYFLL